MGEGKPGGAYPRQGEQEVQDLGQHPLAPGLLIPANVPAGEPRQQVHQGYDWLYVLSGRLRLLLGEHDLILAAGEVAEFDTRTPRWFGNPGPGPMEALGLFGPQGERIHVRARPATK